MVEFESRAPLKLEPKTPLFICCLTGTRYITGMRKFFVALLLIGFLPASVSLAGSEQDKARDAYQRGEIMSLSEIRRNVHRNFEGEIIGTKFRPPSGREELYIYKFRVLSPDGNVIRVDVDARTSRVLRVKGKGKR